MGGSVLPSAAASAAGRSASTVSPVGVGYSSGRARELDEHLGDLAGGVVGRADEEDGRGRLTALILRAVAEEAIADAILLEVRNQPGAEERRLADAALAVEHQHAGLGSVENQGESGDVVVAAGEQGAVLRAVGAQGQIRDLGQGPIVRTALDFGDGGTAIRRAYARPRASYPRSSRTSVRAPCSSSSRTCRSGGQ